MTAFAGAVVIGIGNEFRRDDGVGPAVAALVRERSVTRPLPAGATVHTCDAEPGRLMGLWEDAGLAVVVDACFPPSPRPGRVHRWCPLPDTAPRLTARHSTHGLGLAETVRLAHVLGRGPRRLVIYAVEGADSSLGTGLTPAVAGAARTLAEYVEDDIARHARTRAHGPAGVRPAPVAYRPHTDARPIRFRSRDTPDAHPR